MDEALAAETERLTRMWMRHNREWLQEYLVAGVEDPRLNTQSIFSRHALIRALFGQSYDVVMDQELRFAVIMTWLLNVTGPDLEQAEAILHALRYDSDNAEGVPIPRFVLQSFRSLPQQCASVCIPNYLETFLEQSLRPASHAQKHKPDMLHCFARLWPAALDKVEPPATRLSVLEPACGSANEYRFYKEYGLARFLNYTGFDLCEKNIANARALAPGIEFNVGNVFEIDAPDRAYDWCIVHDLFEHLSLEGLERAIAEVCRVTREALCIGFFQMDEIGEHIVRPLEDYFCNRLSMRRVKQAFASHGFLGQVLHIGTFLRAQLGWGETHNAFAYTFLLRRSPESTHELIRS